MKNADKIPPLLIARAGIIFLASLKNMIPAFDYKLNF